MSYIFISDFDNTLTNSKGILEQNTINDIKKIKGKLVILTYKQYDNMLEIIEDNNISCDFFCITSQKGFINNMLIESKIEHKLINKLLLNFSDYIYTAYTTDINMPYVINYQERLNSIYPKNYQITKFLNSDTTSIIFAVNHPQHSEFYKALNDLNLEYKILAFDTKRDVVLVSKNVYSKADIIKLIKDIYKNRTYVGIGDSEIDYEFIKECDIKIAMKNSPEELKKLCDKITELDCDNNGCLYELLKLNNS